MEKDLKVLMISSDRKLFVLGSAVSERMKEYGALVGELHIVVLSDAQHKLKDKQLSNNVWIYQTNSMFNFLRPLDAARIGKKLVFEKKFIRGKSLITADSIECGWAGVKIKKKWRIPLEVQFHTDLFSPYFSGFQNGVRKLFVKKVLRAADSVRVVSENLKSQISPRLRSGQVNISVLPIYIDKKNIEDGHVTFDLHARYPWRFILLTVSRLAPEKNLSLTLEALALVREKFPDTGLVIVGSGPEEGKLKILVKKLELEGVVDFVGWQDDLASFYKTANAFIQTSLFEGYGLALIEAGLFGLPVITTSVGIAQELEHGKDALIYPIGNADLFAGGIVDLIENNHKRENLRANMKHTLESKLISKEVYLEELKSSWGKIARLVV